MTKTISTKPYMREYTGKYNVALCSELVDLDTHKIYYKVNLFFDSGDGAFDMGEEPEERYSSKKEALKRCRDYVKSFFAKKNDLK